MTITNIKIDFKKKRVFLCIDEQYIEYCPKHLKIYKKLLHLLQDIYSKKFNVMYYACKGKYWYLYFNIRSRHLNWFHKYKVKRTFRVTFIRQFIKEFKKIKNEGNWYLLNIKNQYSSNINLLNVKLTNGTYRFYRSTINKPMSKYKAHAISYYAYYKKNDVFLPISKKDLTKYKFNYNKIKSKYQFYNTNYNKYEILAYKIACFYKDFIDIDYKINENIFEQYLYKIRTTNKEYIKQIIIKLLLLAYKKHDISKLYGYKKGLLKMTLWNKKRIDESMVDIIKQFNKIFK